MTRGGVILTGGSIHPMAVGDTATAEAIRLDGRRITHVGSLDGARAMGNADIVDLDGGCLLPGFVDAHTHPLMHGQCGSWADLAILDTDPFTVATESLPDVSVIGTWVDGRPAWTDETGVIDEGRGQA